MIYDTFICIADFYGLPAALEFLYIINSERSKKVFNKNLPDITPKRPLTYTEFIQTIKVFRMLYGVDFAKKYLTDNLDVYYNVSNS